MDSGLYSVTVTVNGCTSPAGSTNAAVHPLPPTPAATNNGPVCSGSTLQLSTPGVAGGVYSWTGPNGFISNVQSPVIASATTTASGLYAVTVSVNGCPSGAGTTTAVVSTTTQAPVPVFPANGKSGFQDGWVSWSHPGGAAYDVYFDTVSPPQKMLAAGLTDNFDTFIPSSFPGTTYYWRVVARTPCGSAESAVFSLTAGSCAWTGAGPALLYPLAENVEVGPTTVLRWDAVPGASYYDVYLGPTPSSLQEYRVVPSPVTALEVRTNPGSTYHWKVVASPVCGIAPQAGSSVRSFTTAGTGLHLTGFTPGHVNRWLGAGIALNGSGFLASSLLFTDSHRRPAGPYAQDPNSVATSLFGLLGADTSAPAGRYDAGVTESGVERARLANAFALRAFTDVNENDYYYLSSARLADAGIMEEDASDTPGPQFSPAAEVTRASMAVYLAKAYQWWRYRTTVLPEAFCTPSGDGSLDFPDVPCSHPDWLAIHWIKAWDVTKGSPCAQGTCYLPANAVTRGEMVTFLERLKQGTQVLSTLVSTVGETDPGCSQPYPACSGWTDPEMKTAAWPRREVNVGFNDRLTTGCAGTPGNGLTMCVQGLVTRGQIAEFLGRTIGLVPNP
jgi:hypothetical protein